MTKMEIVYTQLYYYTEWYYTHSVSHKQYVFLSKMTIYIFETIKNI